MRKAVMLYQRFFKLPLNGIITAETLKHMSKKRCACPDIPADKTEPLNQLSDAGITGEDPFVLSFNGGPWPSYNIAYRLTNTTSDLTGERDIIDNAFSKWAEVSPLVFTKVDTADEANIKLSFETGDHDDGSPFDGSGNILAHGFFPTNGNVHFDDAETWRKSESNQRDFELLEVAIHEIGHALGLGHARSDADIMFPHYNGDRAPDYLGENDIAGILSIYPFITTTNNRAKKVNLEAFAGGSDSVVIDLGSEKKFIAFGQITYIDSLSKFDRDNAVALDIFTIDDNPQPGVAHGGDHLGSDGAPSNLMAGARVATARKVQFRLRAIHSEDLAAYGVGCVIILD
jgi:hypothetical protein